MKDIINGVDNCNDSGCKFYAESFELNCSYGEDNSRCFKLEKANDIKPLSDDARSLEVVMVVFDWIQNHAVIKNKEGKILDDAYIDIGDKSLSQFISEYFI